MSALSCNCGALATTRCDLCGDPLCGDCIGRHLPDAPEIGGGPFTVCRACCCAAEMMAQPWGEGGGS